jgi:hypothetical protein
METLEEFKQAWDSIDDGLKVVKLKSGDTAFATNYEVVQAVDNVKMKHELYISLGKDVAGIWVICAVVKLKNIKRVI